MEQHKNSPIKLRDTHIYLYLALKEKYMAETVLSLNFMVLKLQY